MRIPRPGPVIPGLILVALSALAACSGSPSTVSLYTGQAAPTPPPSVPTLAPATAATTVPLAASTPQPISIPPAAGLSGTLTLPAATIPPGTTLNVQTTTVAPTGVPALAHGRSVLATGSSGLEVLYYQGLAFSQTVTFPGFPAFTIALPSGYDPSVGSYGIAFYDGTGWHYPVGAPGTPSGQQITFTSAPGPVTYQANQVYFFALYYAPSPPSPTPTPTAAPTASPTASPSPSPSVSASPTIAPTATPTPTPTPTPGPVTASPSSLSFLGTGANLAQTVTVSSTFYTGSFTASTCDGSSPGGPTVASVSAVAADGTFTVTPDAPGACTITVTDATGRTATVGVTVATSNLTVQSRKH